MPWYTPSEGSEPVTGFLEESAQPRGYAWQQAIANGFGNTLPSLVYEAGKRVGASEGRAMLTQAEALKRAQDAGYKMHIGEDGVNEGAFEVMLARQQRRARRAAIVNSSNMTGVEQFSAELLGSLPDPINLVFLPLGLGSTAARTGAGAVAARIGFGVAEGALATAAAEPAYYTLARRAGDDYAMADSLMNIAFGGVTGGLFHAAPEVWRGAKQVFNSSMSRPRETRALLPHALDQSINEQVIDIDTPARALHEEVRLRDEGEGYTIEAFHGTNRAFEQFDLAEGGANTAAADAKSAIFFSDNPDVASGYARFAGNEDRAFDAPAGKVAEGANVRPVRLKMDNPRVIDWQGQPYSQTKFLREVMAAKRAGNDGVVFKNVNDDVSAEAGGATKLSTVNAVFSPDQVRSRFGNIGDAVGFTTPRAPEPGLGSVHRSPAINAEIENVNLRSAAPAPKAPELGEVDADLEAQLTDAIAEAKQLAEARDTLDGLARELEQADLELKQTDEFAKSIESALLCALRKGAP